MGIDGLGQSNIIRLRQLMAQSNNSGARTRVPQIDVRLTHDGSIFDAPKTRTNTTQQPNTQSNTQTQSVGGISVSEGLAQASSAKGLISQAKSGRSEAEQGTKQVKSIANSSRKLAGTIARDEKSMQKTLKDGQRKVDKNNGRMRTISGQIRSEVELQTRLSEELKSLQDEGKYSVYSLSMDSGGGGTGPDNSEKIESVQARLASSGARISRYSGSLQKLQTANMRTIRTMNRTSRKYQRNIARNQKTINANQTTSDKIMNVANTVGEVSMYTSMTGQGVKVVAKLMRYLGQALSSNPYTAAFGAALITASVPVEETGVVVETVGNYGSTAASLTKAAVSAANGDIQGAITNVMAASMTAVSAAKGTAQISGGFEGIKQEAQTAIKSGQEALKNNVEKQAAKQAAKEAAKDTAKNTAKDTIKETTKNTAKETASNVSQKGAKSSLFSADKAETRSKIAKSLQTYGQGMSSLVSTLDSLGVFGQSQVYYGNPNYDYSRGYALLNSIKSNPRTRRHS